MAKSVHPEPSKNFGEPVKYDPDFKGPLSKRSCTDILCLGLFVVFLLCWVGIGIYAIKFGSTDLLLVPRDSQGQRCGHSSNVKDRKYLLFFNLAKCAGPQTLISGCNTPQVCVEKCPTETYVYNVNGFDKNKAICLDGVSPPTNDKDMKEKIDAGKCAPWYIASEPVFKRCIYSEFPTKYIGLDEDKTRILKDRVSVALSWLSLSVQNTIAHITDNKNAQEIVTLVTQDLIQSWWKIILGLLGAMVVCLIYIILMRWIAGIMVWLSIVGVVVLLAVGVFMTATKYKSLLDNKLTSTNNDIWEQKDVWLALLIITSILLGIVLLILIFLRKRILIAIALIKEGSKAVSAVTSTLFFPIAPWILQLLVVAYAITIGLYLTSVGDAKYTIQNAADEGCNCGGQIYKNNDTCNIDKFSFECAQVKNVKTTCANVICTMAQVNKPSFIKALHAFNIIGAFWGVFFMSAFGEMVLAATFATWYWTFRKSDVPFFTLTSSVVLSLRYHVGTLAFGSLIITICRLIRVCLEYIDHKLKKYDNGFVKAMLCCCKCFFWCLEKFLKFINKNAYIMCAIHGRNFCMSAKDAFNLLMRNVLRVFVVDKVTDMLLFLAKILVTATVGVISYTAFTNADFNVVDAKDLHYVLVPVIVISIGAYFISSVFFGVYSMAVDTLFLCFLEDCERNDGSPEKPYYMSKELMRILGKKNKRS